MGVCRVFVRTALRTSEGTPSVFSKPTTQEPIHEPKQTVDDTIRITCPECNHQFGVKAPEGVDQAVVACPACNIDFGIEFG